MAIGSACEVLDATAAHLNAKGEKVGVVQVALYRPWAADAFLAALPKSVTVGRDPRPDEGSRRAGRAALSRRPRPPSPTPPRPGSGRRCRSSSAAATGCRRRISIRPWRKRCSTNSLKAEPKHGFTVGINDDVSHTSLAVDPSFDIEPAEDVRALFYGLGADGTVGANKNSVKILADRSGPLRAGLLRLRLEEVGVVDDLPPALRAAAYPCPLSAQVGELHRRAQVRLRVQAGRARRRGARRHGADQQSVRAGGGLERIAAQRAAADDRQGS